MKRRILSTIFATVISLATPHIASAVMIIDIGTTAGSLTQIDLKTAAGPALNLVNASSPY